MLEQDLEAVKSALPDTYTVQVSKHPNAIHCVSRVGILKDIDDEDDEHWGYVMAAFRKYFGNRFLEVFHNVCYGHTDFTIFLRKCPKPTPTSEIV